MRAVMFCSVLILLLIFFIKRPSFVTSNSVFYSFQGKELNYNAATFIYESLYLLQNVKTLCCFIAAKWWHWGLSWIHAKGDSKTRYIHEGKEFAYFSPKCKKSVKNNNYLVDLIDSFKKVQDFVLTEVLVNKDLHYGCGRNIYTKSLNLEEMIRLYFCNV